MRDREWREAAAGHPSPGDAGKGTKATSQGKAGEQRELRAKWAIRGMMGPTLWPGGEVTGRPERRRGWGLREKRGRGRVA